MQPHGRDGRFDLVCPDGVVVHHVLIAAVLLSGQAAVFLVQQGEKLVIVRFDGGIRRRQAVCQRVGKTAQRKERAVLAAQAQIVCDTEYQQDQST